MIILHRKADHKKSEELEKKLKDLVISFKTEHHNADTGELPYIEEDGVEYKSQNEIGKWLTELRAELNWHRSISGDGCYTHPNEKGSC